MIHKLLDRIVQILQQELAGALPSPAAAHIVVGPVADPAASALPLIALTPGALDLQAGARDASSSQPRPQPFTQEIAIDPASPQGPYALAKTPLRTSMICKLIQDPGTLDERRVLLVEGGDYTVDYQNAQIRFIADVAHAGGAALSYSYAGVFTVQNFRQDFLIEVYDATHALSEKWLALALAAVLTSSDELLERYNATDKTLYSAGTLGSAHQLTQIQPVGCAPAESAAIRWQMTFRVSGQLTLTRAAADGFSLIEKIRSPGRHSGETVDIGVELG
ncbi:MAG: hypothetical protein JF614_03105 [Acidobacteria bacterium]|nr:hypothetical protein [Acidobacteriota bacterium]